MTPHIRVAYVDDLPDEPFDEFVASLRQPGLEIEQEARQKPGPVAAVEWLLPTAVIVYLAKPYFEAFLKEAGKDHYNILKRGLERLGVHFTGPKSPQVTVIYSDGKAKSPSLKYSLTYSVVAELGNGISAKLLLQTEASSETVNLATESFLDFLQAFHDGSLEPGVVVGMEKAQPVGGMLLLAFNPQTGKLEVVDPVPKHVRDKQTQA